MTDQTALAAVNSFKPLVEALEADHGPHWKEAEVSGDLVVNISCEEDECAVCTLLAAIKKAAEGAIG